MPIVYQGNGRLYSDECHMIIIERHMTFRDKGTIRPYVLKLQICNLSAYLWAIACAIAHRLIMLILPVGEIVPRQPDYRYLKVTLV